MKVFVDLYYSWLDNNIRKYYILVMGQNLWGGIFLGFFLGFWGWENMLDVFIKL